MRTQELNDREKQSLSALCAVSDGLKRRRFCHRLKHGSHNISMTLKHDGTVEATAPEYDQDHLRSFLADVRKLIAEKEPTNIYRIIAILGRVSDDKERAVLKQIKKQLSQEGSNPPLLLHIGKLGEETPFPPHRMLDVVFNADIFHSDPKLQDALEKVQDAGPLALAMLLRYATMIAAFAQQFADVIRKRGYLN